MSCPDPIRGLSTRNCNLREQFWKPLAPFFFASVVTVWGVAKMQDMGVKSE